MTLAYRRKGETYAELGAEFAVSTTTAWRYVNETSTCSPPEHPNSAPPWPKPGFST